MQGHSKISKIIRTLSGRKKTLSLIFELKDNIANGKNPINKIKEYLKITSNVRRAKTDWNCEYIVFLEANDAHDVQQASLKFNINDSAIS